ATHDGRGAADGRVSRAFRGGRRGATLRWTDEGVHAYVSLPGDLVLVVFEIFPGALSPTKSHFHGGAHPFPPGRIFGALVEGHNDVAAQPDLSSHGALGAEEMCRTIQMRAEGHAILGNFAQVAQAEHLES